MYVCVCKAVTDKQIHQAINEGACSRRQLHQCTGAGSVCGKCRNYVTQILDETLQIQPIMQAA
ncbi:MAG: (2Fe-2S)-binding protein [Methylococcaceae bacterium]|nr:(2Fe-2S)-binding protein [Methylococcaceae bacterium]